jgi:hypothetical protein
MEVEDMVDNRPVREVWHHHSTIATRLYVVKGQEYEPHVKNILIAIPTHNPSTLLYTSVSSLEFLPRPLCRIKLVIV